MARTRDSNNKRQRLIDATAKLVYEKTLHTTTLADIAQEAQVPLGNVYYYFKTKQEIMEAVVARQTTLLQTLFSELGNLETPAARIIGFIEAFLAQQTEIAQFGCPLGSLALELSKAGEPLAQHGKTLMLTVIHWLQKQFEQVSSSTADAEQKAYYCVSTLQGFGLLTLSLQDTTPMMHAGQSLITWVQNTCGKAATHTSAHARVLEPA